MEIVEFVPNISVGGCKETIDQIANAANSVSGAKVLHVDSSVDADRTVITVAGAPTSVLQAAIKFFEKSAQLLDIGQYKGVHPCIGAVDVCPFVPLRNSSSGRSEELATQFAQEVAKRFGLPIFLYGAFKKNSEWLGQKRVANIRRGGIEKLSVKLAEKNVAPDFGPAIPHPKLGATLVGVRDILIAYNVDLATDDLTIAKKIASEVRSNLQHTQVIAWSLASRGITQISTNLLAYQKEGLAEVYSTCKARAAHYGVVVTGSEIVGMVPEDAILNAGEALPNFFSFNPNNRVLERALCYL